VNVALQRQPPGVTVNKPVADPVATPLTNTQPSPLGKIGISYADQRKIPKVKGRPVPVTRHNFPVRVRQAGDSVTRQKFPAFQSNLFHPDLSLASGGKPSNDGEIKPLPPGIYAVGDNVKIKGSEEPLEPGVYLIGHNVSTPE